VPRPLLRADGATGVQLLDFAGTEAELSKNFLVVLSDIRRSFGRHLGDATNLDRTADRRCQLAAGTFEWDDDLVGLQLRIVDDLLRSTHGTKGT